MPIINLNPADATYSNVSTSDLVTLQSLASERLKDVRESVLANASSRLAKAKSGKSVTTLHCTNAIMPMGTPINCPLYPAAPWLQQAVLDNGLVPSVSAQGTHSFIVSFPIDSDNTKGILPEVKSFFTPGYTYYFDGNFNKAPYCYSNFPGDRKSASGLIGGVYPNAPTAISPISVTGIVVRTIESGSSTEPVYAQADLNATSKTSSVPTGWLMTPGVFFSGTVIKIPFSSLEISPLEMALAVGLFRGATGQASADAPETRIEVSTPFNIDGIPTIVSLGIVTPGATTTISAGRYGIGVVSQLGECSTPALMYQDYIAGEGEGQYSLSPVYKHAAYAGDVKRDRMTIDGGGWSNRYEFYTGGHQVATTKGTGAHAVLYPSNSGGGILEIGDAPGRYFINPDATAIVPSAPYGLDHTTSLLNLI